MAGLVKARVREEVYYREAMRLGLDKDDIVIRRRLHQKMEFIADDVAAQAEPSDAELTAYMQAHPDSFRVEPRFTFQQVYLNPEKRGKHLARDGEQLQARLSRLGDSADAQQFGDPLMLEHTFTALPTSELAKQFGPGFVASLSELSPGNGMGRSSPVTARIWYVSASAPLHICRRWRKCLSSCVASGITPGGHFERLTTLADGTLNISQTQRCRSNAQRANGAAVVTSTSEPR